MNGRTVRVPQGGHTGVEWDPQKAADLLHHVGGITYQVFVLKVVNLDSPLQEPVSLHGQLVTAQQGPQGHASLLKPYRSLAGPNQTATDIRRITPDNDKASIWKIVRHVNQGIVLVWSLISPDRSRLVLRVFAISRFGSCPDVRIVFGYFVDIDLMALYTHVPKIPSLQPFQLASPSEEKRPQQWQVGLKHQRDLRVLIKQDV